jgi:hypothetical protein
MSGVARTRATDAALWFGLLAAPLAWAIQVLAAYGTEEAACPPGGSRTIWGLDPDALIWIVSAGAAAAAALGLVVAVAGLRGAWNDDDPLGRAAFMAFGGVLTSALFLGAILLGAGSLLALDPCEAG